MTEADLLAGILAREGGYTNEVDDHGGPTNFGITAAAWGGYRGLGRAASADAVEAITRPQAIQFYRETYLSLPFYRAIAYEPLRVQLIDFAVNSGAPRAIRWLQRVLGIPATGVVDNRTKIALLRDRPELVNTALVAARLVMYDRIIAADPSQLTFRDGWRTRALSFVEVVT